jgi:hypothetical protein
MADFPEGYPTITVERDLECIGVGRRRGEDRLIERTAIWAASVVPNSLSASAGAGAWSNLVTAAWTEELEMSWMSVATPVALRSADDEEPDAPW